MNETRGWQFIASAMWKARMENILQEIKKAIDLVTKAGKNHFLFSG